MRTELPAIVSFPARSRLMTRPWPTKRSCQTSQALKVPSMAATLSITDSTGRFVCLLTPTLGVDVDSAWVHRNWGNALRSGFFDVTSLGLKGLVYRNDLHEMLVSARLGWGIGHSGAQGISANAPDLLQPGIFLVKVSVIFRTDWHGCGRSALLAQSRSTTR